MKARRPLDLLEAVKRREVSFEAWANYSYWETRVKLRNETRRRLEIDLSRSGLVSRTSKSQRIGLSHPAGSKPGDYVLVLKPGQEQDIVFRSRCFDKQGLPPSAGTEYVLIPELLPNFAVDALRQGLDQGEVWEIIDDWGGDLRVMPPIPAMVDKL